MLTEIQCRSAKPSAKAYKLSDNRGLYLFVTPTGFRSWRWKYRHLKKERVLVFGSYPSLTLKNARELRDEAQRLLKTGRDPGQTNYRWEAENDQLRDFSERWCENQSALWTPKHADMVKSSLEKEIYPFLGHRRIETIGPIEVRDLLQAIQDRGAVETAHRIHGRLVAIFSLAIADGKATMNPAEAVRGVLKPISNRRQPALIKIEEVRTLIRAVEATPAHPVTKLASHLLALTAVRPSVIRFAEPHEFEDLNTAQPVWRIPAYKMKLERKEKEQEVFDFLVPLSRQAVDIVTTTLEMRRGLPWMFPSVRNGRKAICENTLSFFYKRMPEFRRRHVPHGWRSSFSTIMNERAALLNRPGDRQVIDLMLAHSQPGIEPIYNRALYMPRRREIAQEWADLLMANSPPAATLLDGPRC